MIMPAKLARPTHKCIARGWCSCFRRSTDIPVVGMSQRSMPVRALTCQQETARAVRATVCGLLLMAAAASPAVAQSFEDVGTRAQGMGGAFVAVADDASATWWNPAGLGGGAYFSSIVEHGQWRAPMDTPDEGPATQSRTYGLSLGYPALGLSYYRFRVSERGVSDPGASIAAVEPVRQDPGRAVPLVRAMAVSAFGATVGQSLGNHVIVATTLRLLRAGAVTSTDVMGAGALDRADDVTVKRETRGDLDVGAMVRLGAVSVGGTVRHVGEPGFGRGETRMVLKRQARAGVAVRKGRVGVFDSLIGALDVDMTRTTTVFGDERRLATGGEVGMLRGRVWLRGGLSTNTLGDQAWQQSVGASLALRAGLYVDGVWAPDRGASQVSRAGWGVSLRSAF